VGRPRPSQSDCSERVDLVALMLQKACEDLLKRALPVAEPESVLGRDRVQLNVGQLGDSAQALREAESWFTTARRSMFSAVY
jgi:hypothetical protein